MYTVNAMGDACPIPVVKTIKAIKELNTNGKVPETVEVFVDNEIAVQNLTRMAAGKQFAVRSEKQEEKKFRVEIEVTGSGETGSVEDAESENISEVPECIPDARRKNTVVVISSDKMGNGDDELGTILMKSFLYALSQQEELPTTILCYNGGAKLACTEAPTLDDLKSMEAQGVEILVCGTCLNHYGLTDRLQVGSVTNMYVIVEKMTQADRLVRP